MSAAKNWICYTDAVNGFRSAVSREGAAISYDIADLIAQARGLATAAKTHRERVLALLRETGAPEELQEAFGHLSGNTREVDRLYRRAPAAEAMLSHPTLQGLLLVRDLAEVSTLAEVRAYTQPKEAADD